LLSRRNRDGVLAAPAQWNAVLETILNHRSVRGFLPDQLPDGTLELLIAAAQSASSSSNLQFWSVVAVQESERKSRLAELAGQQQFIRDAPLLLVWLADLSRLDRIAAERQAQVEGTHYVEEFIVGVVDAALAAQSALIAAESLSKRVVPDKAQTDSSNAWTKDAADTALYDGGSRDGWEIRPQSKNRKCQCGGNSCDSDQCSL